MRPTRLTVFLLAASAAGCSPDAPSAPDFQRPVVPALEAVDYALLGGGKIAFERIGQAGNAYNALYVIDAAAGSSAHYFNNTLFFGAALSPDGRRVAYTFFDEATRYDVFVANLDRTDERHVTSFSGQEGPPTWTPDGSKVVVAATTDGPIYDIYSQSPVANPTDQIQHTSFSVAPGQPFTCPLVADNDTRVVMSGQGLVAFACMAGEIDVLSSTGRIAASYNPDRTNRRAWPNVFSPVWSPDGARLAFIETTADSATGYRLTAVAVKVMNADGSNVGTIVSMPTPGSDAQAGGGWVGLNNFSLCWMPDGSRLVFNLPESALVGHLWVVQPDGTGLAQLTTAPGVWDRSVSCARS
ncbi:MAG TPA: hypothetical protein VFS56_02005 [Gemmatimonadaceae bacterium]|nr:hypothetical protein [Gemmatimonadaceae bacterium]